MPPMYKTNRTQLVDFVSLTSASRFIKQKYMRILVVSLIFAIFIYYYQSNNIDQLIDNNIDQLIDNNIDQLIDNRTRRVVQAAI